MRLVFSLACWQVVHDAAIATLSAAAYHANECTSSHHRGDETLQRVRRRVRPERFFIKAMESAPDAKVYGVHGGGPRDAR